MTSPKSDSKVPKLFGSWDNQTKELQSKFPGLTNEDLILEPGKENDLIRRMETRLGRKRDEIIQIIKETQTEEF